MLLLPAGQKQRDQRNEQRITKGLIAAGLDMALGMKLERRSGKLKSVLKHKRDRQAPPPICRSE